MIYVFKYAMNIKQLGQHMEISWRETIAIFGFIEYIDSDIFHMSSRECKAELRATAYITHK